MTAVLEYAAIAFSIIGVVLVVGMIVMLAVDYVVMRGEDDDDDTGFGI